MRPSISADGQSIAFASYATNLISGDTNGKLDIFVRDIQTGTTTRAAMESSGSSISADGRYIAFASNATNHVPDDTNGVTDVFVYDRQTGIITRVSVDSSGKQANAESGVTGNSFLSADGRYVTFYSRATNLVHGDINEFTDIFVYDLQTGMTSRVSKGLNGTLGNSSSVNSAISADGQFITFYSFAINLVENDTNSQTDIFVYRQTIYPILPTISGNVGVSGAILSYTEDGIIKSAVSDINGNYVIQVNEGWSGTITPSKANTTFIPVERTYNSVQSNLAEDYLATLTVSNSNNRDAGSLRQAIADAASGATIIFDPSLAGQIIKFASDLTIDKSLRIMGSGLSPQLILNGGNVYRLITPQFYSSNITISDVTITNFAGILAYGGDVYINNSTLKDNTGIWGGALYGSGTLLAIENSTFTNNQAGAEGGAIYFVGTGNVRIVNSTITKNQAKQKGGGVRLQGSANVEVINSTLAENSAPIGSEFSIKESTSHLDFTNSIVACAQLSTSCYDYLTGSVTNTNSILESGTLANFGLNMLDSNGGPTQTMMLSPDSPAIDAGNDSFCPATDQRGVTRPVGSHCDIGAFEFSPKTIYVKHNANGLNNGTSWANAYNDLQSALTAALSGDEIWVAAGIYKPTTGTDRSISFALKNGVAVYGGFAGNETILSQRDYRANITILSGDIGVLDVNTDNSYHVVVSSNTNSSTILDGFTVTGGNADGSSINPQGRGGGMLNVGGDPTLSNIIFSNNSATLGGGMFNEGVDLGYGNWNGGDPILTNISFTDNSATEGGGMENMNHSSPTLMNVTFSGNTATRTGGGMDNFKSCSPTLTNVTFKENSAGAGGGMENSDYSQPTLTNVTFINNTAEIGGGLGNYSSSPTLTNVTFIDNVAIGADPPVTVSPGSGGGIYNGNNSNPVIRNTILWGNTALDGAQVYDATSTPVVSNSVVQGGYAGGTNIITADPKLGTLGDYGGFTETIPLLAGSPAIDTGNDAFCPETDQRGVTRPQGSHCDIGAYEYVPPITPPPTDTPLPTRTPRYPILKSGALTSASLTSQFGTTSGSPSSLNLFDQSGTQDNPDAYVSFQTLEDTFYLGYQSFTLPADAQAKLVSTMLLQVNFKAPASPHQVWTWSIYNWSTGMWIPLGDSIGTTPDEWQTLLFHIRQPRRYISAAGEIRIQLLSENTGGAVKIDYQALHITYLSFPATATPEAPLITSDQPSIFSVPSTPKP
ncbi:MAG: choice-of-anchor Q domain-containing protein [Anaerolineales bacterium]